MDAVGRGGRPRVLVTGFEPFPGAPVNPTAWLVAALSETPPPLAGLGPFCAKILPVDYREIGPRLSAIGASFSPDIAIHFGLARECRGFRLERSARNRFTNAARDNAGFAPANGPICAGAETLQPTLPLAEIHDALTAAGLPVEWSDDAGGYLCNAAMTLSLGHACHGFRPALSGFVHVPMVGQGRALGEADLLRGAAIIIETTLGAWQELQLNDRGSGSSPSI